jgi:hypothetical protein
LSGQLKNQVTRYFDAHTVRDPAALKRGFVAILLFAILSGAMCAFLVWMRSQGPYNGLPPRNALVEFTGRVLSFERLRRSSIMIWLEDSSYRFGYDKKGGGEDDIEAALCRGCLVTLWATPDAPHGTHFFFQIAVENRMVRSYEDVRQSWAADNALVPWLAWGCAAVALYFGFMAFMLRKRLTGLEQKTV